jgi:hypothetical protein
MAAEADQPVSMDLDALNGLASDRLIQALRKMHARDSPDSLRHGLEELMTLTKRTDDVAEVLAELLEGGLLKLVLSFLSPDLIHAWPGEVTVRGIAVVPVTVPQGEAIQLAACTALGERVGGGGMQVWTGSGITCNGHGGVPALESEPHTMRTTGHASVKTADSQLSPLRWHHR